MGIRKLTFCENHKKSGSFFVWYRDPITGKSKWVKNQPYSEWAKSNGQKTYTFEQWKQVQGLLNSKSSKKR